MMAHVWAGKHVTVGVPDGGEVFSDVFHHTASALSNKEACFRSEGGLELAEGWGVHPGPDL